MRAFFQQSSLVYRASLSWWLATITLATIVGVVFTTSVQAIQTEKRRFGSQVTVLVATKPLTPGSEIRSEDYREESRPRAFLEDIPLAKPSGRTIVKRFVPKNAVLTEANLGHAGASPLAQLLRDGERGVLLPLDQSAAAYRVGDVVDLHAVQAARATADPSVEPSARTGTLTLATGVRVVDATEGRLVIAVPRDHAEALVAAVALGTVTPVFSPEVLE